MFAPVKTLSTRTVGGSYGMPLQEGSPDSSRVQGCRQSQLTAEAVGIQAVYPSHSFCQNPILHPVAHHRESEEMSYSIQGVRGAGDI